MSFADVIAGLGQGSYTVTRTAAGSRTAGRYSVGSSSSLSIIASIQPLSGRDLKSLPEGQHADDCRTIYTSTELRTRTPSNEPDQVAIDGEAFEVYTVRRWDAFGETYYLANVSRLVLP